MAYILEEWIRLNKMGYFSQEQISFSRNELIHYGIAYLKSIVKKMFIKNVCLHMCISSQKELLRNLFERALIKATKTLSKLISS